MTQLQLWLKLAWCASPSNSSKPQHHLQQQSWAVFYRSCRASSQTCKIQLELQNSQRMGIFVKYQIFSCCHMYYHSFILQFIDCTRKTNEDGPTIPPSTQEMCRKTGKLLLKDAFPQGSLWTLTIWLFLALMLKQTPWCVHLGHEQTFRAGMFHLETERAKNRNRKPKITKNSSVCPLNRYKGTKNSPLSRYTKPVYNLHVKW